ncbi:PadR family transcriptional regulator [Microlunatus sp. Gsoil 973]|nr:PadR family transcriptional regulator [Microlunatus sp. Gsoil 973]
MLAVGPRHPYDIHRLLLETGKVFVTGLPRSLYHAVSRLEKERLIKPIGTQRQVGRPERTVYALTAAGRAEARRRVEVLLRTPTSDTDITYAALSFLAVLERGQAVAALHARTEKLSETIERLTADLAGANTVQPLLLVESEYELARLRAERDWMSEIAEEIASGRLEWLDAFPPEDDPEDGSAGATTAGGS